MANDLPQYRVRSDVRFRRVADEGVVVRQTEGEVLVLNGVGVRILESMQASANARDLIGQLSGEYDVGTDELATDVAEFLRELTDAGVIERDAGTGITG